MARGAKRKAPANHARNDLMSIDVETARKVAHLARIRVEEEDLPALAGEFNAILGFIEQLGEVDVEGVEPMVSVTPMRLKRRDDVVTDGNQQAAVLKNAPDAREGFFAVPKVVE
jgi:aspartyl-tRNA(Asn)/glutamyl-tRNA(Gln) amidotransferase subunit C